MQTNPNISYQNCRLCARECGIDRAAGKIGRCGVSAEITLARAALHAWEEPIISGARGSGTVFFSGCSLGCVYCQNRVISRAEQGRAVSPERLSDILLELQGQGAHNINFVTPTHYAPSIVSAVADARAKGLSIPIVYNTSSYDRIDTLRALESTVDIYLPDLKYYRAQTAKDLSLAEDYCEVAWDAICEMVRQKPEPIIENGLMRSGVIVRILLLPGHLAEAKLNVKRLFERFGDKIYVSLMAQYTPMPGMSAPLDRRVSRAEYAELVDYAVRLGVKNAFTQELGAAEDSFIPPFDYTGL